MDEASYLGVFMYVCLFLQCSAALVSLRIFSHISVV